MCFVLQVEVYRGLLRSKKMTSLLYGAGSGAGDSEGVLPAITLLRKICNHPKLLLQEGAAQQQQHQQLQHAMLQGNARLADVAAALLQEQLEVCRQPVEAVELSGGLRLQLGLTQQADVLACRMHCIEIAVCWWSTCSVTTRCATIAAVMSAT
jgi:SNF2 family DNA or RNA helicase